MVTHNFSEEENVFDHIHIQERTDYRDSGETFDGAQHSLIHQIYRNRLGNRWLESKFNHQGVAPKIFGKLQDSPIKSICLSENFKYLFTSDRAGSIKQYDFCRKTLIKNFGKVHGGRVVAMACSREYLLSVCEKGIVNQIDVEGMDLGGEPYCYGVLGD